MLRQVGLKTPRMFQTVLSYSITIFLNKMRQYVVQVLVGELCLNLASLHSSVQKETINANG